MSEDGERSIVPRLFNGSGDTRTRFTTVYHEDTKEPARSRSVSIKGRRVLCEPRDFVLVRGRNTATVNVENAVERSIARGAGRRSTVGVSCC
jgi:hypothetical protein